MRQSIIPRVSHILLSFLLPRRIDKELDRLLHKDELERKWVEKNAKVLETHIPAGLDFEDNSMMEEVLSPYQRKKDRKLARNDPQAYCADRCLTTGNCDIYEEL